MQKKTGPRTSSGKEIASKNAIKHGGFAKNFVNDEEKKFYHSLVEALKKDYPNSSTLMVIQIDRIARIQVQLHRIQNTIDATFVIAKNSSNQYTKLFKQLDFSSQEQSIILKKFLGIDIKDHIADEAILETSIEINVQLAFTRPTNHDDILQYLPKLCRYLYDLAQDESINIEDYLLTHLPKQQRQAPKVIFKTISDGESLKPEKSLEDQIRETPYELLNEAIDWYSGELGRIGKTSQKIKDFTELLPTSIEATTPNLDELDKLMRYQTTLQRQLSTAIGELLKLNETNISRDLGS